MEAKADEAQKREAVAGKLMGPGANAALGRCPLSLPPSISLVLWPSASSPIPPSIPLPPNVPVLSPSTLLATSSAMPPPPPLSSFTLPLQPNWRLWAGAAIFLSVAPSRGGRVGEIGETATDLAIWVWGQFVVVPVSAKIEERRRELVGDGRMVANSKPHWGFLLKENIVGKNGIVSEKMGKGINISGGFISDRGRLSASFNFWRISHRGNDLFGRQYAI